MPALRSFLPDLVWQHFGLPATKPDRAKLFGNLVMISAARVKCLGGDRADLFADTKPGGLGSGFTAKGKCQKKYKQKATHCGLPLIAGKVAIERNRKCNQDYIA